MNTELAVVMEPTAARQITDRIKVGVEAVWELIKQAYIQGAWSALGYQSWDDYCTREFGTSRLRLPREERPEVVASLRESGMSIREIASATGDSHMTVQRELAAVTNVTAGEPVEDDEDALAKELIAAEPSTPAAPSQPRRRPLIDQARDAGWDLRKSVERIERLAADDRFNAQAEKMAPHLRGHLTNAIEVCQDILDRLNTLEDIP